MLEIQFLDELGQGQLPGLLLGVCQAAELLGVQPQLSGHLELGMGKLERLRTSIQGRYFSGIFFFAIAYLLSARSADIA